MQLTEGAQTIGQVVDVFDASCDACHDDCTMFLHWGVVNIQIGPPVGEVGLGLRVGHQHPEVWKQKQGEKKKRQGFKSCRENLRGVRVHTLILVKMHYSHYTVYEHGVVLTCPELRRQSREPWFELWPTGPSHGPCLYQRDSYLPWSFNRERKWIKRCCWSGFFKTSLYQTRRHHARESNPNHTSDKETAITFPCRFNMIKGATPLISQNCQTISGRDGEMKGSNFVMLRGWSCKKVRLWEVCQT